MPLLRRSRRPRKIANEGPCCGKGVWMFCFTASRMYGGGLILLLLVTGCFRRTAEQLVQEAEQDQFILNEFADADMDELHERLRQHLGQLPRFDSRRRSRLGREESLARLQEVSRLVEADDLDEAARQLDASDLDLPDELTIDRLRAVVHAMQSYRDDLAPLAARAAAFALHNGGNASVRPPMPLGIALLDEASALAAEIRDDLKRNWVWAWRFQGISKAGFFPAADGQGPGLALYSVQGYHNMDLPEDLSLTRRRLEHYHFAVFVLDVHAADDSLGEQDRRYSQSYILVSDELYGGVRIFIFEEILAGDRKVLDVYDTLPSYEQVSYEVLKRLGGWE